MNSKVYIDIETSGFSQQEDKIIEIAAKKSRKGENINGRKSM